MYQQPPPKRLYRSRSDRMIAGVCGGIAEYFNVDPTFIRIIFIGLMLAFLSTLIIYLIMWIIVPEAPSHKTDNDKNNDPS